MYDHLNIIGHPTTDDSFSIVGKKDHNIAAICHIIGMKFCLTPQYLKTILQ